MSQPGPSDSFDLRAIQQLECLQQVVFEKELSSTNDLGLKLTRSRSVSFPALVLCETQTAGRGRGNHQWITDSGALTFSLLLPPAIRLGVPITLVSLMAGLSIQRALATCLESQTCQIKWPNDVLLSGKKVAGILIESNSEALVVGIGINVANPAPLETATSVVDESELPIGLHEMLLNVIQNFFAIVNEAQKDLDSVSQACQAVMAWRGEQIELEWKGENVSGIFQGVDSSGGLILQCKTETHVIFSATNIQNAH